MFCYCKIKNCNVNCGSIKPSWTCLQNHAINGDKLNQELRQIQ